MPRPSAAEITPYIKLGVMRLEGCVQMDRCSPLFCKGLEEAFSLGEATDGLLHSSCSRALKGIHQKFGEVVPLISLPVATVDECLVYARCDQNGSLFPRLHCPK